LIREREWRVFRVMRLARTLLIVAIAAAALGGALAACATREIPYATLDAKYALTTSQRFEPQPGLRIHYTDEGNRSGRTLIFVHGFSASVHAWRPWIERLRDTYRLIAIDLPGHGLTEAPGDYRASLDSSAELVGKLADHAGVERFVLAGNSMGGAVSLVFAMRHPERLDGLVLVDAAGWPGEEGEKRGGPPGMFAMFNNPVGRGIIKWFDPRMFAAGGLKSAYLDETLVTQELIDRYGELALAPGHRDILLTQNSRSEALASAANFAKIPVPTLVMSGEQDELIPVEDSRAIAAAIPGAKLVTYPGVGHVPMEQTPDQSADDLKAFLGALPEH
jgi:pimeloyl-ACP methyl ester carboxylesterase